jgi:hypothetical protein
LNETRKEIAFRAGSIVTASPGGRMRSAASVEMRRCSRGLSPGAAPFLGTHSGQAERHRPGEA